jgi:hypothetical protein
MTEAKAQGKGVRVPAQDIRIRPMKHLHGEKLFYIQWNADHSASDIAVMNLNGTAREVLTEIGAVGSRVLDLEHCPGSDYLGFVSSVYRGKTPLLDDGFLLDLKAGTAGVWTSAPPESAARTKRLSVRLWIQTPVSTLFLAARGNPVHRSLGPQASGSVLLREIDVPVNDPLCWIMTFSHEGMGDVQEFHSLTTDTVDLVVGPLAKGTRTILHLSPSRSGRSILYGYGFRNDLAQEKVNAQQSYLAERVTRRFTAVGLPQGYRSIMEPAISPDERSLAYCSGNMLANSLVVTSVDRPSEGTVILQGGIDAFRGLQYSVMAPAWSPDGSRLTCVIATFGLQNQAMQGNVYVLNRDGTGMRQLTQLPANMVADEPVFSPDGSTIAFTVFRTNNPMFRIGEHRSAYRDICTVPANGGVLRFLTQDGRSSNPCYVRFSQGESGFPLRKGP